MARGARAESCGCAWSDRDGPVDGGAVGIQYLRDRRAVWTFDLLLRRVLHHGQYLSGRLVSKRVSGLGERNERDRGRYWNDTLHLSDRLCIGPLFVRSYLDRREPCTLSRDGASVTTGTEHPRERPGPRQTDLTLDIRNIPASAAI